MILLKNAYVLTLNPLNDFGRYCIAIIEGKVSEIISCENTDRIRTIEEKFNENVIDCTDKIIMPGFVNSCLKSEGALIKYLMKRRHYELVKEDLTTDFMLNYIYQELPSSEVIKDLTSIYEFSLTRELKCGITFLNEISPRKDTNHFEPLKDILKKTGQTANVCYQIKQEPEHLIEHKNLNFSVYLTDENQLTIYDMSALNGLKANGILKLFLEVALSKESCENFRKLYNKPVIVLMDEYGLIDEHTSLINPLYLTYEEMKIIKERDASIIICPRDLAFFSNHYFPFDEFLGNQIKFSVATGWLGEDIFQELRLLRTRYRELNLSSKALLESITKTPKTLYFDNDCSPYYIDKGKNADLIFINLNDLRFQLYPENNDYDKLCDFIIDNLSVYNITDVMVKGQFQIKDNIILHQDENTIIKNAEETRGRLYKVGKYTELQERDKQKKYIEELDLRARDNDEIILFSDTSKEKQLKDEKEEFRIKGKMQVIKQKTSPFQKSFFDIENIHHIVQEEEQDAPLINLLCPDVSEEIKNNDEIKQIRAAEAKMLSETAKEKKTEKKILNDESKIELPKNVKLKFGDD
jgi:hypothetical protein